MSDLAGNEPVAISLVAHTVFCPRRAWLEAVGEEADSVAITAGTIAHKNIDKPSTRDGGMEHWSLPVHHRDLGLTGICDVVRATGDDLAIVEFKSTPLRRRPEPTDAMAVQLALQRLCLTDMGHVVAKQGVYFVNHKQNVDVELTTSHYERAVAYVAQTRRIVSAERAPAALVDDPRCAKCSHVAVCMPDERRLAVARRRISVADPDGEILYLVTPGSRASLSGGRVRVVRGDGKLATVPFERVRGIVVYGNVDLSTALIRELCWRRLTCCVVLQPWACHRPDTVGRGPQWAGAVRATAGHARRASRHGP